jgi:D-sedoheptulose 7-phosphate isomerase
MKEIKENLLEAQKVLNTFLNDNAQLQAISDAAKTMIASLKNNGKIISCGNGGSMCDAMHFAEELSGRFREDRKALAALSISDPSHLSCVGNDYGYDFVFSRYLEGLGREGDVLLAISTSGNSKNVLNAIEVAKRKGIKVIGLTGKDGGKMAALCDVEIRAPFSKYADRAQEIHIKVIHSLINFIEAGIRQS